MGGLTAAVACIDADGLSSRARHGTAIGDHRHGEVLGADDVAYIDGELYIGVDGGGAGHGNPDNPSGIYHVLANGTAELVVDLSAWTRANPVAAVPGDSDPDAGGYSIVAEPSSGTLYVGDPNSGQILNITPTARSHGSPTCRIRTWCPPAWPSTPMAASTSAR